MTTKNSGETETSQTRRRSEVSTLMRKHTCPRQRGSQRSPLGDTAAGPFYDIFPAWKPLLFLRMTTLIAIHFCSTTWHSRLKPIWTSEFSRSLSLGDISQSLLYTWTGKWWDPKLEVAIFGLNCTHKREAVDDKGYRDETVCPEKPNTSGSQRCQVLTLVSRGVAVIV